MVRKRKRYKKNLGAFTPVTMAIAAARKLRAGRSAPSPGENVPENDNPVPGSGGQQPNPLQPATKKSVLNETDKKIIRGLIYGATGLIIGGTTFLIIRKQIRKHKRTQAEKDSLSDESPDNFAKRLIMAFDNDGWWGTDVEAVRRVFVQIPSKEVFKQVMEQYNILKLKKSELIPDLTNELTTTEFYEMQNILAAKPDRTGGQVPNQAKEMAKTYARRLNSAVNYKVMGIPGTDEDAIHQVLTEMPTKRMWKMTLDAYQHDFGLSLETELDNDLGWFDFSWREMILNKPMG